MQGALPNALPKRSMQLIMDMYFLYVLLYIQDGVS